MRTPIMTRRARLMMGLVMTMMLALALIELTERRLRPIVQTMAEYECRTAALEVMNEGIEAVLSQQEYPPLLYAVRSEEGHLQALELRSSELNRLKAELTKAIAARLAEMPGRRLEIPLGTLLGWQLFSGRGPCIPLKIVPSAYVQSIVKDSFEAVGINQTQYRVLICFETQMTVAMAGYSVQVSVENEVCVAQTTVMGEVPQVYASQSA